MTGEYRGRSDRIEPALSAEEWADAMDEDMREGLAYEVTYLWGASRPAATIAIANAALPDSDARKITRAIVKTLRSAAITFRVGDVETMQDDDATAALHQFADALASYLPPE